jgi:DNA segregation ATPase FtsK/SpoIIIE-like protein
LVLIFDEFADLILAGREDKQEEFEALVARIAGKGRATGIISCSRHSGRTARW